MQQLLDKHSSYPLLSEVTLKGRCVQKCDLTEAHILESHLSNCSELRISMYL